MILGDDLRREHGHRAIIGGAVGSRCDADYFISHAEKIVPVLSLRDTIVD